MVGAVPFGCGQCLPCRINRRRLWQWRMFYESQLHQDNCFVTLTYSDENVDPDGNVVPAHLRDFLKRLRKRIEPRKCRYFAVGEYGDETQRPHYHLCIFGLGIHDAHHIDAAWGLGLTSTFEFNADTAGYVAGYVIKKLTKPDDPRLNGRHPEFARMSNRPGIGAGAMDILADQLSTDTGMDELIRAGDVPSQLMIGKRKIPLGRYLRQKLREAVGMPEHVQEEEKQKAYQQRADEMQALLKAAIDAAPNEAITSKTLHLRETQQRILQVESWNKIKSSRGKTL